MEHDPLARVHWPFEGVNAPCPEVVHVRVPVGEDPLTVAEHEMV